MERQRGTTVSINCMFTTIIITFREKFPGLPATAPVQIKTNPAQASECNFIQ